LIRLLERRGHTVVAAACIAEALEIAERDQFDLVLSDLGLPDGDGHSLMRQLRSKFGLNGIALSGFGMEADVNRSKEAGFAEHLTKPVAIDQLQRAIERILEVS
jgi:CheY-like chemotaxis protein